MEKIKTDKISLEVNSSYDSSHNLTMFIEDLKFSKYRVKDGKLNIEVKYDVNKTSESDIIERVRSLFNIHKGFWRNELNEVLLTVIENIWYEVISEGYCVLERVKDFDNGEEVLLIINEINDIGKKNILQKYYSLEGGKKYVKIPLNKCYFLKFPEEICNYKQYRKILSEIKNIDKKDPMFSVLNPTGLKNIKGYDYIEHKKKLNEILFSITKDISWDFRSRFSSEFSDYYIMRRNLLFKKNKLILFNHVTNFVKGIVEKSFQELEVNFKFHKSILDIDNQVQRLENGNYSQKEFTNTLMECF